jgi:hypothetical protein
MLLLFTAWQTLVVLWRHSSRVPFLERPLQLHRESVFHPQDCPVHTIKWLSELVFWRPSLVLLCRRQATKCWCDNLRLMITAEVSLAMMDNQQTGKDKGRGGAGKQPASDWLRSWTNDKDPQLPQPTNGVNTEHIYLLSSTHTSSWYLQQAYEKNIVKLTDRWECWGPEMEATWPRPHLEKEERAELLNAF